VPGMLKLGPGSDVGRGDCESQKIIVQLFDYNNA